MMSSLLKQIFEAKQSATVHQIHVVRSSTRQPAIMTMEAVQNKIILMYRGKHSSASTEYNQRRAKLKNIQCAMASFELSSKAWNHATLEMGRNFDLMCDAIRALHSTNDLSSSQQLTSGDTADSYAVPAARSPAEYVDTQGVELCELLADLKRDAAIAFSTYTTTMQQGVTSPLFQLIHDFKEVETLRHHRDTAQEQFDVDDSSLERKEEDYKKRGKALTESKKYADMVLHKNVSQDALNRADAEFGAAYLQLVDTTFHETRFGVTKAAAECGVALYGVLKDRLASIAAAASKAQGNPIVNAATAAVAKGYEKGREVIESAKVVGKRVQDESSVRAAAVAAQFASATASIRSGYGSPPSGTSPTSATAPSVGETPPPVPATVSNETSPYNYEDNPFMEGHSA
jgi:hypothetical protein